MSKASDHWLISTQVSKDGGDLDGERPSSKDDALGLLDKAYADAGKRGGDVFRNSLKDDNGLWGAVLYKDRMLHAASGAHANAVFAGSRGALLKAVDCQRDGTRWRQCSLAG